MEKLKVRIEESVDQVSFLENLAYYLLLGTAFLLPLFFVPSQAFSFQFSKSVFVSVTALVALTLWLVARLKDGRHPLPNNLVFLGSLIVLITMLVAAVLSPAVATSFIGQGYEVGTWANFLVLFVMMFLFSSLFRPKERVFYLYLALFGSFFLIVLFHALRFAFGADFLSFGIFNDITSNLIGKWNDLGIFFALVAMLSMLTIELLTISRFFKTLVWIIFILSILSLSVVNFPTIWYALAFFSMFYFVYAYAYKREFATPLPSPDGMEMAPAKKGMRGSVIALLLIVLSLVFLADSYTADKKLGTAIAEKFGVSHLEVRPNWESTLHVAAGTLRSDPFFGAGPNRFNSQWLLNKPSEINESLFWNTDFNFGIGLIPTFFVSSGFIGAIAWLLLIVSVLYVGLRSLLTPVSDRPARYLSVSSFFASLFLWTFVIFYIPSTAVLALTFLFTGIFLASLYNEKLLKPKTISFSEEPKISFLTVLVLTALLIGTVSLAFVFSKKFIASSNFQRALIASNVTGNIDDAEKYATRALKASDIDLYRRFLTELNLSRLNTLLQSNPSQTDAEAVRVQFQNLMGSALSHARAASEYDATNYLNWIELGRVYEAVVPLKIEGAFESAKTAYDQAKALNPASPQVELSLARLSIANGDNKTARMHVDAALALKSNYTEAIFLLSQIQVGEGKVRDAIASVESATVLAPNDPTVFFQLGLLKYNNRDYRGAITALERSVQLAPSYANAKYFLGLSYYEAGRVSDSLTQFNDIVTLNPGNQEVPVIIRNIRAGRDPFSSISESRPQERDTLPVEEETPVEEQR